MTVEPREIDAREPPAGSYGSHYALVFYPELASDALDSLRREHDPTVDLIRPHLTVVFPVPAQIGEARLIEHIEGVLADTSPFEIRLGGFEKSPDHWLLMTLEGGEQRFKKLYLALHTGILADDRLDDLDFVPHLGIGLFLRPGATYDWEHPREADFDRGRYLAARREAEKFEVGQAILVETLHLVTVPGEVVEWATGRKPGFSRELRAREVQAFRLGGRR